MGKKQFLPKDITRILSAFLDDNNVILVQGVISKKAFIEAFEKFAKIIMTAFGRLDQDVMNQLSQIDLKQVGDLQHLIIELSEKLTDVQLNLERQVLQVHRDVLEILALLY